MHLDELIGHGSWRRKLSRGMAACCLRSFISSLMPLGSMASIQNVLSLSLRMRPSPMMG